MKLKLTTGDNKKVFIADTAEDLVMMLHKDAWLREATPERYMKEIARRIEIWNGSQVRTDDAMNFIMDITKSGMVETEIELEV